MATESEQAVLRHGTLYRRLLWLYPASFRKEYRQAMVQLFCDQLRNQTGDRSRKATGRVWLQALRDLATSVPDQRIEVFMSEQQTTAQLIAVIITVSLSIVAILFVGLYAAVLLAAVTGWLVYQRGHGRYVQLPVQSGWYRWVLSGAGLLVVAWVPVIFSPEFSEWLWGLWALVTVAGLLAVAVGAGMGMRARHRGSQHAA